MSDEHTAAESARGSAATTARSELVAVLLRDGAVSEAQVRHAERVREKLGGRRPFVPLLLELGLVRPERVRAALCTHRLELRIGTLLVELGHLREADVERALQVQEASDDRERKLGEILIELGLLGAQELASVLSSQLGIPCAEAGAIEPEPGLLEGVPLDVCRRHRFVPLRREDGRVCVAFADPLDKDDASAAQAIFGPAVSPWIASSSAIDEALARSALAARVAAGAEAGEREAAASLHEIFAAGARSGADELHFEPGPRRFVVRARRDGVLSALRELPAAMGPPLLRRLAFEAGVAEEPDAPHRSGRLRLDHDARTLDLDVALFAACGGECATIRIRDPERPALSLDDLGLVPSMRRRLAESALAAPGAVLLVAGPPASGRTTTLRACVAAVADPGARVVLLDDEAGAPIPGVSRAPLPASGDRRLEDRVAAALGQLPDVVAVGSVRGDAELAALLRACRPGPRILAVCEADDAVCALERAAAVAAGAPPVFAGALAQRLVRRVCAGCAEPFAPSAAQARALGAAADALASPGFRRGRGCSRCGETGYSGRIGLFELVLLDDAGREGLRAGRGAASLRRSAMRAGPATLLEDGLAKAARGLTTIEELLRVAPRSASPRALAELERVLEQES